MKNDTRLHVTEHLLTLERGRNELLLANYLDLRPLYIKEGRKYIKNFLKAASELGTYNKIIEAFPNDISLLDMLVDHGIIIPGDTPKNNTFQMPQEELRFDNRRSISLYLLISQSCNMGCIYCLNGTKTYQKDKDLMMSQEIAFKSIERCLDALCPQGYLEVIFFGGEPLLNWPLAKEIIIYCENALRQKHAGKQIKYHFTTNLSLVPADLIEWATRYNVTFLCDVDGPPEIHNKCRPFKNGSPSHEVIVKNIGRLTEAGLSVFLRTTITSLNHDRLLEITSHHRAIGGKSSAFVPVNPVNSDEDVLTEKLLPSPDKIIKGMTDVYKSKLWKDNELYPFNQHVGRLIPDSRSVVGCGAPYGNTPVVDVTGDVYPCIYLVGMKRYYMGNIMNESYPDKNVLRWIYNYLHVDQREDCKTCSWRYICGGACALGRLTVLDNPAASGKVRDYCRRITCEYTKEMLELLLWDKAQVTASELLEDYRKNQTPGMLDANVC
jgi:uncharacterized protein